MTYAIRATPAGYAELCATRAASWRDLFATVRHVTYEGPYPTAAAARAVVVDRLGWMTPGLYRYDVVAVKDAPVRIGGDGRPVRVGLGDLDWCEWAWEAQEQQEAA